MARGNDERKVRDVATYERALQGDFDDFLAYLDDWVLRGSRTASAEGHADVRVGPARIAVRVYERYSAMGSSRVSLNLTIVGVGPDLQVVAITSGGSQAMFFKINTLGEDAFLDAVRRGIDVYQIQDR